jgi:hypothetical protein
MRNRPDLFSGGYCIQPSRACSPFRAPQKHNMGSGGTWQDSWICYGADRNGIARPCDHTGCHPGFTEMQYWYLAYEDSSPGAEERRGRGRNTRSQHAKHSGPAPLRKIALSISWDFIRILQWQGRCLSDGQTFPVIRQRAGSRRHGGKTKKNTQSPARPILVLRHISLTGKHFQFERLALHIGKLGIHIHADFAEFAVLICIR